MPPTNSHHQTALDHLSAVQAHADNLREEWSAERPNATDVKYLTASIGRGLKLAEIHASLEIGHQIKRLADRLEDDDLLDFLGPEAAQMTRLINGRGREATR